MLRCEAFTSQRTEDTNESCSITDSLSLRIPSATGRFYVGGFDR